MKTRNVVLTCLLGFAALAGVPGSAAADELDSIVAQVIQILEAGVSDELIIQWLQSTGHRPRDIGSRDLIALAEVGASERLVSRLLELAGDASALRSMEAPEPATAPEAVGAALPDESTSATGASDSRLAAQIRLGSKQIWVEEAEPDAPRREPFDVFLYLDGQYAARVGPSLRGEPVELRRLLDPGLHEMRLLIETHRELKGRWSHESQVVPAPIAFEAEPGAPLEIEIDLSRGWGSGRQRSGGPLSYIVRQGGRVLAERQGTGGDPDQWPLLCEDIEANFPDAGEVPRRFRSEMSRCVRWATLWSGSARSSSREELLAWMAESDYRPPKGE